MRSSWPHLLANYGIFFSDDLQHRGNYNGVTVLNPFLLSPVELDALLA